MNKKYRMVTVKCDHCGENFERINKEVHRSTKLGRKQFCSRRCCGLGTNNSETIKKRIPSDKRKIGWKIISNYSNNRRDGLSQFRYFMHRIRNRTKDKIFINIYDIELQWKKQNGICPYTGLKLELPKSTAGFEDKSPRINRASIDRINSSIGYTKENIQFVSCMANYAKNDFSHDEMVSFCRVIAKKWA